MEGDVARDARGRGGAEDGVGREVAEVRLAKPSGLRAVVCQGDEVHLARAHALARHLGHLLVKLVHEGRDLGVLAVPRPHELARHA